MGCAGSADATLIPRAQYELLERELTTQKEVAKRTHKESREATIQLQEARLEIEALQERVALLELTCTAPDSPGGPSAQQIAGFSSPETMPPAYPADVEFSCDWDAGETESRGRSGSRKVMSKAEWKAARQVSGGARSGEGDAEIARRMQQQYDEEEQAAAGQRRSTPLGSLPDRPQPTTSKWKLAARRATGKAGSEGEGHLQPSEGSPAAAEPKVAGMAGLALSARKFAGRGTGRGRVGPVNESRLLDDQKVSEFLRELAEHLHREQVASIPGLTRNAQLLPGDEAAMLSSAIEDCVRCIVVVPEQARHLATVKRNAASKDAELRRRQKLLHNRTQGDFGVPPHVVVGDYWKEACEALTIFDQDESTDPSYRLEILLEVKSAVESAYSRESRARGDDPGKKPLAADDFMPVFTYIVAYSEVPTLNSTIQYIRDVSGVASGEAGYFLCMLEAALTHVMTLNVATEKLQHNKKQMEDLQKMLEKSGFLEGGKFSNSIFTGQAQREATKKPRRR